MMPRTAGAGASSSTNRWIASFIRRTYLRCLGRAPVSCAAMSCAAAGGLTRMTSITAQTHATLDGVIDAPPAAALLPYMSDAGRQGALDLALAADALLLARETWQSLARAWRDQTGPMAERLNAMPKYVVSATLGSADEWDHTTIVGYD